MVGVRHAAGEDLGKARDDEEVEVAERAFRGGAGFTRGSGGGDGHLRTIDLHLLICHELQCAMAHAEKSREETPVEARDAFGSEDLLRAGGKGGVCAGGSGACR